MSSSRMITCIRARDGGAPEDRILMIGGRNGDATPWRLSLEEAIAAIEQGRLSFHTLLGDRRVPVVVELGVDGRKYLKPAAEGAQVADLLTLPHLV